MKISEVIREIEKLAPLPYQESYDNCGLLLGNENAIVTGVLLSLDCLESVVDEAIQNRCNLIISHHPIIFSGLKKITGTNYIQRTVIKAIQNNIALYACHTNADNVQEGVNKKIADKLKLKNCKILSPKDDLLCKLITYIPATHHQKLLDGLFSADAGNIGDYSNCSFNSEGTGTFKGNENSTPFIGKPNELSREHEIKVETIFEKRNYNRIITVLKENHPYEQPAYDIYDLKNLHPKVGSGMIGELEESMDEDLFLQMVKEKFNLKVLKHTAKKNIKIKRVALCGGSGKFLLNKAIKESADVFITSDFKYHDYFDVENKLLLVDIGHYESEQFTSEIFYDCLLKINPTFAILFTKINTNPIHYY